MLRTVYGSEAVLPEVPRKRWSQRLAARLLGLWERAKQERSSPREIGLSVGLGAFVACTPFVGFHLGIAFVLATLVRQNRLWAMVGSRLSSTPIFLLTTFCEIQLAHRIRHGSWVDVAWRNALAHARELTADWFLGTVLFGVPVAVCVGTLAWALASRWEAIKPRKPERAPGPSSESPP